MPAKKLTDYQAKRDFQETPEPSGNGQAKSEKADQPGQEGDAAPRFVVQQHHATRLHWDLRLEHNGTLASWAIPNGIPPDPAENRLAVRTEDHPLEYLDFQGDIPKGQYGAGTMRIWDRGTYDPHKWEDRKVEVTFHGERLRGRYGLFPIGREGDGTNDWMIHRMDPPEDPAREPMPDRILPMMARTSNTLPPQPRKWSFEIKWDGVRAIAYAQPGRLRLESRNLNDITAAYPEIRGVLDDLGMHEAVLDGEIVAFDAEGKPSFERLQRRMHVTSQSAVRRLAKDLPVVYAMFDLLYLDGHSLLELPYQERRQRLEELGLGGRAWRVPGAHPGGGQRLLEATREQGLEGIVAKRLDCRYEPGRRSGAWLKIKNTLRQELVIGGWIPGEGRRAERIGALLMGYFETGSLIYAGRVGTGFTEATLDDLGRRLGPLRRTTSAFAKAPRLPREAVFVEPKLVAEIEFREWTRDGVMRAPSFKGLREDKPAATVIRESGASAAAGGPPAADLDSDSPEALFDEVEPLPDGALAVTVDGRRLKISNWDKVLYPQTGFTKGDLVAYYARIAPCLVPHLHDRPLTLKRYPNGVEEKYFYEKQSPSHRPEWVQTVRIGDVNYTLCQDRATLVWLANLADIELHTSLSLAPAPERPTMLVFDLDPGPGAGIIECCQVGEVLHGLFDQLGLESLAKTSGSKGLQVYVPLNLKVSYRQTKPLARRIAELLEQRMPELVVSRMTKRLRPDKVLVDWSQNDAHKTTVNVYSARARERPTVSTPVTWDEVAECRRPGHGAELMFTTDQVLTRVAEQGDLFAPVLSLKQEVPAT
ncbi:MAG: DNA ligase D [Solirubrobacterales bacterium]|nr:DNA ligase D [Solirubrobacterales bacterium]